MFEQWKAICRVKDIPRAGVRTVPRGFAWQELPGVAVFRTEDDCVLALLDVAIGHAALSTGDVEGARLRAGGQTIDLHTGRALDGALAVRTYQVRLQEGRVYLDLSELRAPASREEEALAGAYATGARFIAA